MIKTFIAILMCAGFALAQEDSGPPPEPSPDTPACDNHFKSAHKCACGKAMKCHGRIDEPPDPEVPGMKWCSQYCVKSKCLCIGPCETMRRTSVKNAGMSTSAWGAMAGWIMFGAWAWTGMRRKDDHAS